ncbi:MAG: SH3 domain-containing protein [Candidatus Hydrogenedentota bacterium]
MRITTILTCLFALVLTATVSAADILATCTGDRVRVRSAPSLEGDILTQLDQNERVTVLATPEDKAPWVQIRLHREDATGHAVTGWMHGRYLRVGVASEQERRSAAATAAPDYQTVLRLSTVDGLPYTDDAAIFATVAMEHVEDGVIRCTVRSMERTFYDADTGQWAPRRHVAIVPFRGQRGQVWRTEGDAQWAVGDAFLITPAALWQRAMAVPDRGPEERTKAMNALGGALDAMGEAQRMEDTWVVDPPIAPLDPGPEYTPLGETGRRLFKAPPQAAE